MLEHVVTAMAKGASMEELAAELGVRRSTLYDWINPSSPRYRRRFAETVEYGQDLSAAYWSKVARLAGTGQLEVAPGLLIFNLKNRIGWKDRVELQGSGAGGGLLIEVVNYARPDDDGDA